MSQHDLEDGEMEELPPREDVLVIRRGRSLTLFLISQCICSFRACRASSNGRCTTNPPVRCVVCVLPYCFLLMMSSCFFLLSQFVAFASMEEHFL